MLSLQLQDVTFDYSGKRLATSSTDCTARVWDVSGVPIALMEGHRDEVCKVRPRAPTPQAPQRLRRARWD